MGLFGYGKGDYDKNTGEFKQRVNNLLFNMHRLGDQEYGLGPILNGIINKLDEVQYSKVQGKDHKAIDARITKLIESLERDLQTKNAGSFSEHAGMLVSAIDDSRRYGKEMFKPEELQSQETMATVKGHICDALNKKGEIAKKKADILKKAKKLLAEGKQAEAQKLNLEYNACVEQEKVLERRITAFSAQYNACLKVSGVRENGKLAVEMDAVQILQGSEADFAREIQKTNAALEKQMEKTSNITNMAIEAEGDIDGLMQNANVGNDMFSVLENQNATEMQNSVNSASYEESGVSTDEFAEMLKNL